MELADHQHNEQARTDPQRIWIMDKIAHKVTKKLADYQYKKQARPHLVFYFASTNKVSRFG